MIIDVISDLHGFLPEMGGADLLIVAGDICGYDKESEITDFANWASSQNYKNIIFIAGNHDNALMNYSPSEIAPRVHYLCDSEIIIDGNKIWGTPWTKWFHGINPRCKAFTMSSEKELRKKWALIPNDTNILVTHSPPYGILDRVEYIEENVGSPSLLERVKQIKPKIHAFGHIHQWGGQYIDTPHTISINGAYVDEFYQPHNGFTRIEYHDK